MLKEEVVKIYTDGACSGNPGPGGYGIILIHNQNKKELSAGYRLTTNNRMELLAVIISLETLKRKCKVELYSDSKYVVDGIEKGWAKKWKTNNWKRNKNDFAENPDLWDKLLNLLEKHSVKFIWVKGHSTNPENNRCDKLAITALKNNNLLIDEVFESKVKVKV